MTVMDKYHLHSDPCDRQIIRCNNCIQCLSCICTVISAITGQCRGGADCLRQIAHLVYCTVQACMTAQVHFELAAHGADAPKDVYVAAPMQQPLMM